MPPVLKAAMRIKSRNIGEIAFVADIAMIIALAIGLHAAWEAIAREGGADINQYGAVGLVVALLFGLMMRASRAYEPDALASLANQTTLIARNFGLLLLIVLLAAALSKTSAEYSRAWFILFAVLGPAVLMLVRLIFSMMMNRIAATDVMKRQVVVIGSGAMLTQCLAGLEGRSDELHVAGVFGRRNGNGDPDHLQPMESLDEYVRANDIDELIIAVDPANRDEAKGFLSAASNFPLDVKFATPSPFDGVVVRGFDNLGHVVLLEALNRPLSGYSRLIKNLEDRILGALLLIAVLPLFAVIALLIKLESRGPVFFRQRRNGFNNDVIRVFKFRSMRVVEDGAVITQATRGDPRVTRMGKFLRRTSIDELPQLINVVMGEMSIVGPRPHAVAHNEKFAGDIDQYLRRHHVKPGITGWAQIHGLRGETDTIEKMARRVEYDLWYIDNWSLWLDIRIILATPFVVLLGRNAY
ncbi:MAG TPA: undecaprenyl-phosphate glucose phosphotransferase [Micropepsaceae bacterium]|nr:undecaprenyl-phosphate glucose phosphotransferase [Micropepsaceae bacterium]HRK71552.1 undecaprenyl-phosphate glucose phosphotransferase [Micropepsaceae bacterium]